MKPYSRKLAAVFVAMLAGSLSSFAAANAEEAAPPSAPILSTELNGSDIAFFDEAASRIGLLVHVADLAGKHAVTPEIKAEGAAVYTEQSAVAARLTALAARLQVSLPGDPDSKAKTVLQTLGKLTGVKFDKYVLDSLADAQEWLEPTLKAAVASSNGDIKSFAVNARNTLTLEKSRLRKLGL